MENLACLWWLTLGLLDAPKRVSVAAQSINERYKITRYVLYTVSGKCVHSVDVTAATSA